MRTALGGAIFGAVAIVGTIVHVPVLALCITLGVATIVIFFGSLALYPRVVEYFNDTPPRVTRDAPPADRDDPKVVA